MSGTDYTVVGIDLGVGPDYTVVYHMEPIIRALDRVSMSMAQAQDAVWLLTLAMERTDPKVMLALRIHLAAKRLGQG